MSSQQQSPINLTNPIIVSDFGKDQRLRIKWKKSIQGKYQKDEHGFSITFGGDQRQFLKLGNKDFHLVQFHFHHPSEHWVEGQQQTMELHVVSQNINDGSRVVLGIFIDIATKKVSSPEIVMEIKSLFLGNPGVPNVVISTNPNDWLPEDLSHYYRYEGSLTTPDYDENVHWIVFKEPKYLPKQDVLDLIEVFRHPARLPQPLNRRFVLANFKVSS